MNLIKVCTNIDMEGRLILPLEAFCTAGFHTEAEVYITMAVSGENDHPCPMLIVTPELTGMSMLEQNDEKEEVEEEPDNEEEFFLPHELLNVAGIPTDSDLEVTCIPGSIIIKEADILNRLPDGLKALFCEYGIHPETVREVMKKEGYFV